MDDRSDDPFLETILEMARALAPTDPLRQLVAAVAISGEMSNASTEAIYQLLIAAREAGHSGAEIGAALKLGPNSVGLPWQASLLIYEGLTGEAKECVFRSIHEANGLRHNYVATEHLLLSLIQAPSLVSEVLKASGIQYSVTRSRIEKFWGPSHSGPPRHFSPRLTKVIGLAIRAAMRMGSTRLEPEHLLLGLLDQDESVATQLIKVLSDPAEVRARLISSLRGGAAGNVS